MYHPSFFRNFVFAFYLRVFAQTEYPGGTPGFGDLPPSNSKFPPQIDGSRILYFRDLGYIRDISVCANTLLHRYFILPFNPFHTRKQSCHFLPLLFQASDMMTARGSLELCYDEFNRAYRTPLFCFSNPDNLIDMNSPPKIISKGLDFLKSCSQSTFCPQPINLKLRVNPGDFNLRILMSTSDSISDLKHFIYEQSVKVRTFVWCRNVFGCATLCLIFSVMLRTSYSCCLILYCIKLCIDVLHSNDQSNSTHSRTSIG